MNAAIARLGEERIQLVGLVSAAHFMSHLYIFILPPILPVVREDLGITFATLATMMTAYSVVNALCQIPMGFLVDRFGGRVLLAAGLGLHGAAFAGIYFTHSYWSMIVLYGLAGVGQAVFHPADYEILAKRIDKQHLGRAVSFHTFMGNIGWAIAPPVVLALSALAGWRFAFLTVGLIGLAMAVFIYLSSDLLGGAPDHIRARQPGEKRKGGGLKEGFKLMASPALLILFSYFLFSSLAGSGINNITVVSLMNIYGVDLFGANSALTGYLWGTVFGVLLGGWLVDRIGRPNLIAGGLMAMSVVCLAIIPVGGLSIALIVLLMTLVGTFSGASAPSRDILVRQAAGPTTVGVAFGFTSTGFSVAGAVMPPIYGWLLDTGRLDIAFALMIGGLLVAVAACAASRDETGSRR
jgi:MFS family permease